jgi:hypothetical protein
MECLNEFLKEQHGAWMQNTQHPVKLTQGMINYAKLLQHRLQLRTHRWDIYSKVLCGGDWRDHHVPPSF